MFFPQLNKDKLKKKKTPVLLLSKGMPIFFKNWRTKKS